MKTTTTRTTIRKNPSFRTKTLCAAVSAALLSSAGVNISIAQETDIEEVIVTGSFIRRSEGFTGASAITQFNAADLEDQGTLNMAEVVQNLSFVTGAASAVTGSIQGTSSRVSSIDLRGLGASSTLTLLDGKRLVNQNVNMLIPTIAIERMDIVTDGAAALYGSEAVAGVVNFVPYTSYDGFKLDTYGETDSRGTYEENSVQMLWGGDIGDLDVVLAGQFRNTGRLSHRDRPELSSAGLGFSSNSPGNWVVPNRGPDGQLLGTASNRPDPNCAPASERTRYERGEIANPFGMLLGNNCWFDFNDNRNYREPTKSNQYFANATWDVSDDLTLSMQAFSARQAMTSFTSTSNPGNQRIGELPDVRGEIPGNPFRAVSSTGAELFAMPARDAQGNIILDGLGRPLPQRGDDGSVMLAQNQFASMSADPLGGIPFYEDVRARTLRPINKTHTMSDGHNALTDNMQRTTDRISRWTAEAQFNVPFIEGWRGNAGITRNDRDFIFMANQNYDISAMIQGLNCDVVIHRDACYNPFFVVDQSTNNSVHVMNAIAARGRSRSEQKLTTYDLVFTGDLPYLGFELPGGPIGAAVGYQLRRDNTRNTPAPVEMAGDTWIGSDLKETITSNSREVDSFFGELAVPILSNLELSMAVRNESFSTGQNATSPKFGLTYAPTDWLNLRATTGDAFIAPTINQLTNPVTCGLTTVTDRFGPFSAFTGGCGGGNPNLENETSTSQQLGIDLNFGDFDLSVTWNNTDFTNRIISINGQTKMELDFANFRRVTGFAGSGEAGSQPTAEQLRAWINNPASDKDIIRDPDDIFTILQVNNISTTNAERVDVTAWDISAGYNFFVGDLGSFRLGLQATYIDSFLYQTSALQQLSDGAGKYNDTTSAAPALPRWKANLNAGWIRGNHSVTTITRYISSMPYDGVQFEFMDFFGGTNRPQNMTTINSWIQTDASYSYRGLAMYGGELAFTVGARNVFDRAVQRSPKFGGSLADLQDPMGQAIYGRVVFDF
jgi:iron complex outermembrane receptor protein